MHRKENRCRFIVDAMLGDVSKKLRLLGYDSEYHSDIDDDKIIDIARNEKRLIISKDKELIRRTKIIGIESILITNGNKTEEFLEIIKQIRLDVSQINGSTARCPKCNSETKLVEKNSVKDNVPQGVFHANEKFWKCDLCTKIYWEGTHIRKLQEFVSDINERLQ